MRPRFLSRGRVQLALLAVLLAGLARSAETPVVKFPDPGVPEIYTLQGQFVRVAYNNEGYVTLGYRVANQSVGQEWLLLEIGATVRSGVRRYLLKREALSLETPDGKTHALASSAEYVAADLRALDSFGDRVRDPIDYFPPGASRGCRIGFFAETGDRTKAWDQVELNDQSACLGRLYFHVPGGIRHGQHWLNVRFEKSVVRVPFRVLTKEEEKVFSKSWQDLKKELDKAFGAKK